MFFDLVMQTAVCKDITEQPKPDNRPEWVARMNNIKNSVNGIIYSEITKKCTRIIIASLQNSPSGLSPNELFSVLNNFIQLSCIFADNFKTSRIIVQNSC